MDVKLQIRNTLYYIKMIGTINLGKNLFERTINFKHKQKKTKKSNCKPPFYPTCTTTCQILFIKTLTPCLGSIIIVISGLWTYFGDKVKEKFDIMRAMSSLSSTMARCCPTHTRCPNPNGM